MIVATKFSVTSPFFKDYTATRIWFTRPRPSLSFNCVPDRIIDFALPRRQILSRGLKKLILDLSSPVFQFRRNFQTMVCNFLKVVLGYVLKVLYIFGENYNKNSSVPQVHFNVSTLKKCYTFLLPYIQLTLFTPLLTLCVHISISKF